MQFNSPPLKWTIPFANSATIKTEVPATSPDDTRASLALGFPPRTGQPPEAGGVPPQQSDVNGAVNQVARIAWWTGLGGMRYTYDATFAADSNVGGYARGAVLMSADGFGSWLSTTDNNAANPDTVGTGWVPNSSYGVLALAGQTGGTVTLTPAQAAKRAITVAGTLTSNLVLVVPAWTYDWNITNNTTGAFSVTIKTAAGTGAVVPQNGISTPTRGDGTNVSLANSNLSTGRLLNVQRLTAASGTYAPTAGTRQIIVEMVGGGGAGGGTAATTTTTAVSGGGGAGAYIKFLLLTVPASVAYVVGAGGTASTGTGGNGGASNFGAISTAAGGTGGATSSQSGGNAFYLAPSGRGGDGITLSGATLIAQSYGGDGGNGTALIGTQTFILGGTGGSTVLATTTRVTLTASSTNALANTGTGGSGTAALNNVAAQNGGTGGSGVIIVHEYS